MFLIVGDAFTIYAGTHQNRHIHVLTPLFLGFAIYFLNSLTSYKKILYGSAITFFSVLFLLQFYCGLNDRKPNIEKLAFNKEIVDYINDEWPEYHILVQDMGPLYWMDHRQKMHFLYVSVDPYLGRYVKYYNHVLEVSEYIQRYYPYRVIFIDYPGQSIITQWLLLFEEKPLKTYMLKYKKYGEVKMLDLTKTHDLPPYENPYSELDVGDPFSEKDHHYKYVDDLERPIGGCLVEGEDFWDGGRPYVVSEQFQLPVPPEGGILLCRYKGLFQGNILEQNDSSRIDLNIEQSHIKIYSDELSVFDELVTFDKGFSYLEVPLDAGGERHIKVEGLINSFHYWVYKKGELTRNNHAKLN